MENYSPIEKWDGFKKYAERGYGHNYGTVRQLDNKRKPIKFNVNKLLVAGEKFDFRYVTQCKAGWPIIGECTTTPSGLAYYISKYTTCIEFKRVGKDGTEYWLSVLNMKGGKIVNIDLELLLNLAVGNMHHAFPKMVDYDLWKRMNTKSHASFAYKFNTKN